MSRIDFSKLVLAAAAGVIAGASGMATSAHAATLDTVAVKGCKADKKGDKACKGVKKCKGHDKKKGGEKSCGGR